MAASTVRTKYVYHSYEPSDGSDVITILMDDKVFQIPPHEPFEMTADSNGRMLDYPSFYTFQMLMIYGPIYGLVEVEAEKTRTGISLNLERAAKQSSDQLTLNRHAHIQAWVNTQINERLREGKPVLAPTGFVAESIMLFNIDLYAKYKLQPLGWDWAPDKTRRIDGTPVVLASGVDEELAALKEENKALHSQLDDIQGMLGELLAKQPA